MRASKWRSVRCCDGQELYLGRACAPSWHLMVALRQVQLSAWIGAQTFAILRCIGRVWLASYVKAAMLRRLDESP